MQQYPDRFRQAVRNGEFYGATAGYCGAFAQANLVILPQTHANDFLRFCHLNPKACPLLGIGAPGQWSIEALGSDLDIRTDIPGYYLYQNGKVAQELTSLKTIWQDDFVVFGIGCSFSFEQMLIDGGIPLRHIAEKKNVAMYRTNIPNKAAGPFGGKLVVSMRPMTGPDAIRAIQISSRFPAVHGAPVHIGAPQEIGIADLRQPDYGDAVTVRSNELPVFWACGVTPQDAIREAALPLVITHKPGHMLITDIPNATLAIF
jgi:uncharacterized protein YcsI (UPF0317 family)